MSEFLDNVVSQTNVRAVITISVVGAMIYSALAQVEVSSELVLAFGTVIGFYFGTEINGNNRG